MKVLSSEESRFFLQVRLPPLWQAFELCATYSQQLVEVGVRQVVLEAEAHTDTHSEAALHSCDGDITHLCVTLWSPRPQISEP